jgi:hypothetical protein
MVKDKAEAAKEQVSFVAIATNEEEASIVKELPPVITKALETGVTIQSVEFLNSIRKISSEVYEQIRQSKNTVLEKTGLVPGIYKMKGKSYVIIPDSFVRDDYYAAMAICRLIDILGYEYFPIKYPGDDMRETSRNNLAKGILFGLGDNSLKLRITKQNSDFELGRRIVRAQQVIRLFGIKPMVPELLQRNNQFFGNNPGESVAIDKKMVPVIPEIKYLGVLFQETKWENYLRSLLVKLLRDSARLLTREVAMHAIASNILSYEGYVKLYCSRTITTVPAVGKRKAQTVTRVPAMPNYSPLFTNEENVSLKNMLSPHFAPPGFAKNFETWVAFITSGNTCERLQSIQALYTNRALVLSQFGQLTTARLGRIRKIVPGAVRKRKREVSSDDLLIFAKLMQPSDILSQVAHRIDPKGEHIYKYVNLELAEKAFQAASKAAKEAIENPPVNQNLMNK